MDKTIENRAKDKSFYGTRSLQLGGELYELDRPWLMGILNLNPDSFYDGGRYDQLDAAVARTEQMLQEGADLIDLGPTSSRPGSNLSEAAAEWALLEPFLSTLTQRFPRALFSVDTYHSSVAERSIAAGAHMINDISGGRLDPRMAEVIGALKVPYVLTHMQGTPQNMQDSPSYDDPIKEVAYFFSQQIDHFNRYGAVNLILDVGFGFGKSDAHNYKLLNHLGYFKQIFDLPLLAGLSRKSMICRPTGRPPQEALHGSSAGHTAALLQGADFLRVHDVEPARQATAVARMIQKHY
jgi:dihydropteroate synthase